MSVELYETIDKIETRDDLKKFILRLQNDCKINNDEWQNTSISEYLESMAAWIDDMDGYFINKKLDIPENPSWKLIAEILYAAKSYE